MISLTSILTVIKGATLATKIGLGIAATAVVAGGTVGTVAIISHASNKTTEEQKVVSNNTHDDNSPTDEKKTEAGETGESEYDDEKTEQVANDKQTNNNVSSSSQNIQKPSNNTSSSKPTAQPTKPSQSTSPSQPSQPTQPTQPSKPTEPVKRPDYNLNDKYMAGSRSYPFWVLDENGQCSIAEEKSFFGIAKFTGKGDDLWNATMGQQYFNYANSKGYNVKDCLGMGSAPVTWEAVVSAGLALDEAKCAQYGLSCGRW